VSTSLLTTIGLYLNGLLKGDPADAFGGQPVVSATLPFTSDRNDYVLNDGDGADQANKLYKGSFTLSAGASQEIDLYSLANPLGGTWPGLSRVVCIAILVPRTSAAVIKFEKGASNGWSAWSTNSSSDLICRRLLFALADDVTGYQVDSAHRTFKLTNTAGVAGLVHVVVIGS
jgi:hypothetical protein